MRERAIVKAALRELAPLHLGTLAVGLAIAMLSLRDVRDEAGAMNTWPLAVLPIAALWGGLQIGGGSRATLAHLMSRPVSRMGLLAARWGVLLVGLFAIALPLWWIGTHQSARGPSLGSIAISTLLASAFGAQGSTLSDREPYALAGAMMLGSVMLVPVELALDVTRLTWSRVDAALGWRWIPLVTIAFALVTVPVVRDWRGSMPLRSVATGTRTVLASLTATLVVAAGLVFPTLAWVGDPVRGELLAVVGVTRDGPVVATGTRGAGAARDVVDGLVVVDHEGRRTTIWDRHDAEPDATVWHVMTPQQAIASPFDDTIQIAVVDGTEPDAAHPLRAVEVRVDLVDEQPNARATKLAHDVGMESHTVYGELPGPLLRKRGNHVFLVDDPAELWNSPNRRWAQIRSSEIPLQMQGGIAFGEGYVWFVDIRGELVGAPMPWEVQR